jgi:hypothetical protein
LLSAFDLRDASSGFLFNLSEAKSFGGDALTSNSSLWSTTFAANRFIQYDYNSPLPATVPVSSASFNYTFSSNAGSTACFYFDVIRVSTGAVLATHGSSASPVSCTGTTLTPTTTSLPEITDTDIANDVRVKVYGKEASLKGFKVDLASVSVTTAYSSSTLYPQKTVDQANTTPATTTWGPALVDGTFYRSSAWSASFSASRYMQFTFGNYVPTGAVVTSATLDFSYASTAAGSTACEYVQAYSGATLLATHGSTTTPDSCNSTTAQKNATISLPEVDTVAKAQNVVVKVFGRDSGSAAWNVDLARLTLNYSLP